jgi:hypothetical protein
MIKCMDTDLNINESPVGLSFIRHPLSLTRPSIGAITSDQRYIQIQNVFNERCHGMFLSPCTTSTYGDVLRRPQASEAAG